MFIEDNLKININNLPITLQKKICIFTWRFFWRDYVPLTAQIPSWYNRKIMIENMIYQSKVKNIHFLHLPFNIIEENKKWIMGCQCEFCLGIDTKKKDIYIKQYNNSSYFNSIINESTCSNCNNEYFIDTRIPSFLQFYYDPLCGSDYEDKNRYALRTKLLKLTFN